MGWCSPRPGSVVGVDQVSCRSGSVVGLDQVCCRPGSVVGLDQVCCRAGVRLMLVWGASGPGLVQANVGVGGLASLVL